MYHLSAERFSYVLSFDMCNGPKGLSERYYLTTFTEEEIVSMICLS